MFQDIRVGLRSLVRSPSFAATGVLTLALAAGANAAILAVVYAILLKPLPYHDPDRLVAVWPGRLQSNIDLLYLREHGRMFSHVAAVAPGWSMALTGTGEPVKLTVARVSGNLFGTLDTLPAAGRPIGEEHARPGADQVVVLSHELWTRRFAADPAIVGRSIRLEGTAFEVLGIMPRGFEVFGLKADAFTPFPMDAGAWYHQLAMSFYVARLAPGRTLDQADRDYKALIPQIRKFRGYPDEYGRTAHLKTLRDAVVGDVRSSLVALGAAVGLILLVAGANIGVLQLTRAAARQKDLAVRTALGASPYRLARELLAEGALMAVAGGVLGVAVATATLPALVALLPSNTPRLQEIAVSGPVAAGVLAAAVAIALAVGIGPLLASGRLRVASLLRAATSSESPRGKRTRGGLVAAEICAAVVLTIGAGLMIRSVWNLQRIDPGFAVGDSILTLHLQPAFERSRNIAVSDYYRQILERITAIPGVARAGAIQHLPFSGYSWNASLDIEGHHVPPGGSQPVAGLRIVTPGYFAALGQPILTGREFQWADIDRARTVIVNAALAERYFGSAAAAIGRTLRIRGGNIQGEWLTITGVAGDVRHVSLTVEIRPEIYTSVGKTTIPAMMLAIRTSGDPMRIVPALREAIWSIERDVPISDIRPMDNRITESLGGPRLLTTLLGLFAALGVLLAAVGVYGVVAYSVALRSRELGIMIALGADGTRIVRSVFREGLAYAAIGVAAGVPLALAGSRLMRTLVYGIQPTDPATYVAMAWSVAALVAAACALPAYRASRTDPVAALKQP